MSDQVDFHCHSYYSDGELSPAELAQIAIKNEFKYFAITDHDCIDSHFELSKNLELSTVQHISGIEFSTHWNKIGIHVVGLNFDVTNKDLNSVIAKQKETRKNRAEIISSRLEKIGLSNGLEKALNSGRKSDYIGRPNFAQLLVDEGLVKDHNQAYKKYLGAGKIGDVKSHWLDLEEIVSTVKKAEGIAVLAHPLHYKLTNSKLKKLLTTFKHYGGDSIEVVSGFQSSDKIDYLKQICIEFNLFASIGSDFHFEKSWKKLGCKMDLLNDLDPVWDHFIAR